MRLTLLLLFGIMLVNLHAQNSSTDSTNCPKLILDKDLTLSGDSFMLFDDSKILIINPEFHIHRMKLLKSDSCYFFPNDTSIHAFGIRDISFNGRIINPFIIGESESQIRYKVGDNQLTLFKPE